MCVFRILFLLVLMSLSMSAQSSQDKSSVSPQFKMGGLVAPPEFLAGQVPAPSQNGEMRSGAVPFPWLVQQSSTLQPSSSFPPEPEQRCYSIRTYRVTRDDPQSDTTTPAGYSECEAASSFHLKAAVDSAGKP